MRSAAMVAATLTQRAPEITDRKRPFRFRRVPGSPATSTTSRRRRLGARFTAMTHYDCGVPGHGTTSVRAPTPEDAAKEAVRRLVKSVPPTRWTVDLGDHRVAVHAVKVESGPFLDEYELTATLLL